MASNPHSIKNSLFDSKSPSLEEQKDRLSHCISLLPKILKGWEDEHPYWKLEALLWILDRALISLKAYIENDAESEITWANPYVELHFPVDCRWAEHSTVEDPRFQLETGHLNSEDVVNKDTASKALTRLMLRHLEITAFQDLTNGTAFAKRGELLTPVCRAEDLERIQEMEDPVEREKAARLLFNPLSFGAGTVDLGDLEEGVTIDEDAARQLADIEPPLISLPLEINGKSIQLITILKLNPLIADEENKTAYFPILVGLAIQTEDNAFPADDWLNQPWASFANWSETNKRDIWKWLHELIQATLEELGPKAEPEMEEARVSVNAEIKVLVPKGMAGNTPAVQQTIKDFVSNLQMAGKIEKLDFAVNNQLLPDACSLAKMNELLDRIATAKTNKDKGESLEALVSLMFNTVPYFSVAQRTVTETEEIDLWITNSADSGLFRRESDVILVE